MEKNKRIWLRWLIGIVSLVLVATVVFVVCLWPRQQEDGEFLAKAPGEELVCVRFSRYSGQFVEDGENRRVSNVAAMLVANTGEKFLDAATVVYQVAGREATFVVTGLPPGKMAWVLEAGGMVLEEDGLEFELQSCQTAFRTDAVSQSELLEITSSGQILSVTNRSDQVLHNVCVYYKTLHGDGNYLGGITYSLLFDTLQPGQTINKAASHYGDQSQIVRLSYQSGRDISFP